MVENPNFKFLLDGQTLVIEDLLGITPAYQSTVGRMVKNGNLRIGPYYCQPDWRLTGGEALIRNLFYGQKDRRAFGGSDRDEVGWLVDVFGHISQAPQLHHLFNVNVAFIWRGVPQLEPYLLWRGADGGQLFTVNLFGGYRNLYGVTRVPEVAISRLKNEITKLQPFYPTEDIPLFDGYDLEKNPEDPIRFFQKHASAMPNNIRLVESSPNEFVSAVKEKLQDLPVINGELNSGKYGATFPGTLSTRTYLKIMHRDCEHLLYRLCEPLAVLAQLKGKDYDARLYEAWGRRLLKNSVHDCICGVSIDQVHEKMEFNYRRLFTAMKREVKDSLAFVLNGFVKGDYAVSTNPFRYEGWIENHDRVYRVQTNGVGVWRIGPPKALDDLNETVESFNWQNKHFSATVNSDGTVQVGGSTLGYFVITEERGDTYSCEAGDHRELCKTEGGLIIERANSHYCVLRYGCSLQWDAVIVSATVRVIFDQTPLIRWQVDLDSRGVNFRIEMNFKTAQSGEIFAGSPFDVVKRPTVDRDLLPRELNRELAKVLQGQRELSEVNTFPFQDFVAISDDVRSAVIFAKGVYAYRVGDHGTISLTLRRSVESLTKTDLNHRAGDAGPSMYVPDARCERVVQHEVAAMIGNTAIDDIAIHQLNSGFQNPPIIIKHCGEGEQSAWQFVRLDLPLSSLHIFNQRVLARVYNPTTQERSLGNSFTKTDVWGNCETSISKVAAKEIVTIDLTDTPPETSPMSAKQQPIPIIWPSWRVGENQGHPDPQVIEQIKAKIIQLETRLAQIDEEMDRVNQDNQYSLRHTYYILKRKLYELRLSVLLNQRKMVRTEKSIYERLHLFDSELAQLGLELNELRIKRRIYDYVVEALPQK